MSTTSGFIGCGNMGGALIEAASKVVTPACILISDRDQKKRDALVSRLGVTATTTEGIADSADYIFLGVKPQVFGNLFEELSPLLAKREKKPVLVTMAAGLSISTIEKMAGCTCGVIRIMPNTPVAVGEGMILYTSNAQVDESQLEAFCGFLCAAGCMDRIDENKIDAASALSGCGPAFVYLFAEALADGAVECGLPREQAMLYAAQTIKGAAELMLQSGKHPGELKDAVCSPGGTTIAGVHALEDGGLRATAMGAVNAAYKRTLELKK